MPLGESAPYTSTQSFLRTCHAVRPFLFIDFAAHRVRKPTQSMPRSAPQPDSLGLRKLGLLFPIMPSCPLPPEPDNCRPPVFSTLRSTGWLAGVSNPLKGRCGLKLGDCKGECSLSCGLHKGTQGEATSSEVHPCCPYTVRRGAYTLPSTHLQYAPSKVAQASAAAQ